MSQRSACISLLVAVVITAVLVNHVALAQRDAKGAVAVSPTIDPATCAVYILAGKMANPKTLERLDGVAEFYRS